MDYTKLFIGGYVSGIQKFLYSISSKKAAVSLKGRSFYLIQYMENTSKQLSEELKEAGAQTVEIIYCSGGKFYILADCSNKAVEVVKKFTKTAKEDLWKEHLGQLSINISCTPFSENSDGSVNTDGLQNVAPGHLWIIINNEFAKQKSQKFKDLLTLGYKDYFCPIPVGGKNKVCAITGVESPDCVQLNVDEDDTVTYVLPSVKRQIQLGESLRNQQHFKSFEDYASNTYLGVLRMDVDGLGQKFIKGFTSINEYKVFSSRLVKFFSYEIEKMQKEQEFRDFLNIIYSGGDDLFIVGRWDKTIDFADRIRKETAKNFPKDGITISGGVAVVHPKFPIAKAAEMAGQAEEQAKTFRNGEKNAFHFLGKTVSWNKEFDYVKNFKDEFIQLITNYKMSKGILHKIMMYDFLAQTNKQLAREGKAEDFSYIWHMSYYLTRMIEREEKNLAVKDFCTNLRDRELMGNNGRNLELMALAARWAELLLRDLDN